MCCACFAVESWPLFASVLLPAEALIAFCGQQGVRHSGCGIPPPTVVGTEVLHNSAGVCGVTGFVLIFWGKGTSRDMAWCKHVR